MQIQTGLSIPFNRFKGTGPRQDTAEVVFASAVTQATAILTGFDVAFSPRHDHNLGNLEVRLEATIDSLAPQRVIVEATFGLRDWSNEWDDDYEGEIFFTVIAE